MPEVDINDVVANLKVRIGNLVVENALIETRLIAVTAELDALKAASEAPVGGD